MPRRRTEHGAAVGGGWMAASACAFACAFALTAAAGAGFAVEPAAPAVPEPGAPPAASPATPSQIQPSFLPGSVPSTSAWPASRPDASPPGSGAPGAGTTGSGTPAAASAAAGEDIRDIRGPKVIYPAWLLPAAVAAVALAALGVYALWRWRRDRRPRRLQPFELALRRLEEMRALMEPARAREFSIAVSDVVRRYIEERFGVTATHRTTEEFLHDLLESSHAPLARHRALLCEFLQQCDLVKFAGMSLTLQNMGSLHHSARAFVLETAEAEERSASGTALPAGAAGA